MTGLGAIGFATPWFLTALASLPVLWYLLRLSPPQPRRVPFPPLRILRALVQHEETPARTPPWLLALRLLIASLVIVALSGPMLNPQAGLSGTGPVILVVDDGWAAAADWLARRQAVESLIDRAERANRAVVLLGSAARAGLAEPISLLGPAEARRRAQALQPRPWGTDRAALATRLAQAGLPRGADAFWVSDGLEDGGTRQLGEALRDLGTVRVVEPDPARMSIGLTLPPVRERELGARAVRARAGFAQSADVLAETAKGLVLGRATARFGPGDHATQATFDLPPEARNQVMRLSLAQGASAGGVALLDDRWTRRVVGLAAGGDIEQNQPLLSQIFYLQRALAPSAETVQGSLSELLQRKLSVLILADVGRLPDSNVARLSAWVQAGGILVRFASPRLAQAQEAPDGSDPLLPVRLRRGDRALGGTLSWEQPAHLAPFDQNSPFFGLAIPPDVVVKRQILAEPGPELADRTWARLVDGTPLVTGARRGEGWTVLVHVTAGLDWSNLPLSGLFVGMLHRLVDLSSGVADTDAAQTRILAPQSTLDGFGRLGAPPAEAVPINEAALATVRPGPRHPPGYYGAAAGADGGRALNLLAPGATLTPIGALPPGLERARLEAPREVDLARWLLVGAILLGLLDGLVVLALRGYLWPAKWRRRRGVAAIALLSLMGGLAFHPGASRAQDGVVSAPPSGSAIAAALDTRLAYVRTGDPHVDAMSQAGLSGLSRVLAERTAFDPATPMGVDPETDELVFYPVLYWPMTPSQRPISDKALAKVDAYMRNGGLILFDTRDQKAGFGDQTAGEGTQILRRLLGRLDIPLLVPAAETHVLTKSFYLLQTFPGRYANGRVWVEAPPTEDALFNGGGADRDGVSSVVIGGNDWAAAWATDDSGQPLAATVPDDERQREMAFRFGVNLVMYALTGNYKADQVHVPALLERLGQ